MSKPNILFIMTDQQRWDAMGCSGGWIQTPNLDRIAGEGIRFARCVTNSPSLHSRPPIDGDRQVPAQFRRLG